MTTLLVALAVSTLGMDKTTSPVTEAEAYEVVRRIQDAVSESVGAPKLPAPKLHKKSSKPLDRELLLDEFKRIADGFQSYYVVRPRAQYLDRSVIKVNPKRLGETVWLIKFGYVDCVSPLVANKSKTLTPNEFGYVVTLLMERLADRMHNPTILFSPQLQFSPDGPLPPKPPPNKGSSPKKPGSSG